MGGGLRPALCRKHIRKPVPGKGFYVFVFRAIVFISGKHVPSPEEKE